jgi:hypothetical protein
MIQSNFDSISYIFMILTAMVNPGILTLIYPFSVFGYALFEETRPPPRYWYFMMGYTQVLILTEFVFSLDLWHELSPDFYHDLLRFLAKYYIGLYATEDSDIYNLFLHFLPKILVLFSIQTYI